VRALSILLLGGASLLAVMGFLHLRAMQQDASASQRVEMAALQARLVEVARSVAELSARGDRFVEVAAPAALADRLASPRPAAAAPTATQNGTPVDTRPTMEDMRDAVQNRFSAEAFDPSWSRAAEDKVREAVRSVSPQGRILSVDCRTSVCRSDVEFADMKEYRNFLREHNWDGPKMMSVTGQDSEGHVDALAFLGRGHDPLYVDNDMR